ncbi:MAG: hypothetical protein BWY31_04291 [Lentisphaerae bacterium ADurb.Bin242]|nr:MAG: hypothetical protein BWY31_04291 [Lentisphaerae bacterium ADurb.Bin242]
MPIVCIRAGPDNIRIVFEQGRNRIDTGTGFGTEKIQCAVFFPDRKTIRSIQFAEIGRKNFFREFPTDVNTCLFCPGRRIENRQFCACNFLDPESKILRGEFFRGMGFCSDNDFSLRDTVLHDLHSGKREAEKNWNSQKE